MTQQGDHTWDLILQYYRCPKCGNIIESRQDFYYQLGTWVKDIHCNRCGYAFSLKKKQTPCFGPLIGIPQPPEWDWG